MAASGVAIVHTAIASAFVLFTFVTTLEIVLSPFVKLSWSTTFPPSFWKRAANASQALRVYTITLSTTRTTVLYPFFRAIAASAAPSSCATLP